MEVMFKREMNHNYMIFEVDEQEQGYEWRMLEENRIEGLLQLTVQQTQDGMELCYEITSLQPLDRIIYKKSLKGADIKRIVRGILNGVTKTNEYMLSENRILLEPEYIYVDSRNFDIKLCFVPGYEGDFKHDFTVLLKCILDAADREDREGVMTAYSLFEISERENYSSADMMKVINSSYWDSGCGNSKDNSQNGGYGRLSDDAQDIHYNGSDDYGRRTSYDHVYDYSPDSRYDNPRDYYDANSRKTEKDSEINNAIPEETVEKSQGIGRVILPCLIFWIIGEAAIYLTLGFWGLVNYGILAIAADVIIFLLLLKLTGKKKVKKQKQADKHMDKKSKSLEEYDEPEIRAPRESYRIQTETYEEYRQREEGNRQRRMEESRNEGTRLLCDMDRPRKTFLESIGNDVPDIEIKYTPFVIGSHENLNDMRLNRSTVSRMHVRIDKKEGVSILTDLNSTNGTIVNGYRLNSNETVSIKDGDRIYLADVGFVFHEFG